MCQIRFYGRHNDPPLDLYQVETPQGNPHPGVDHNAFVEYPIQDV
jgi:hypothetical protein